MDAKDVMPGKWLYDKNYLPKVLYDDGEYSVIWGKYENTPAMGVRWNDSFPNQGGNPTWHVEPDFIATSILQRLLTCAIDTGDMQYYDNIRFAIEELNKKMAAAVTV